MFDLFKLPSGIPQAVDFILVPVTLAWFAIRWSRLVRGDSKYPKALKATRRGFSAGILRSLALLVVFNYNSLGPSSGTSLSALSIGVSAHLTPELVTESPNKTLDDAAKRLLWKRGAYAALEATGCLVGLVLRFAYSGEYIVHQWLLFAFMMPLCFRHLSMLFGE